MDTKPPATRWNDSALQFMSTFEQAPASSDLFAAPIHLNAKANALIACALHERLTGHCGANQCGATPDQNDLVLAQNRHRAYCDPRRNAFFGALHKLDAMWDRLQDELHPILVGERCAACLARGDRVAGETGRLSGGARFPRKSFLITHELLRVPGTSTVQLYVESIYQKERKGDRMT